MTKRIYISADYSEEQGDRDVCEELSKWGKDNYHSLDFVDMAQVVSGSVADDNPDCRSCDLKAEFNQQISKSSIVLFVIGDKTAYRTAGSSCKRNGYSYPYWTLECTPYKQNSKGSSKCKVSQTYPATSGDVGNINSFSYLRHEYEEAKRKGKKIVVVYNSTRREASWLPCYMEECENIAVPFWTIDKRGNKVGNYPLIKVLLGDD